MIEMKSENHRTTRQALAAQQRELESVGEGPQIKAETWFSLALAASIITACIFGLVALWIFSGEQGSMQPRAQAFTPFGAALIAVVTFCTIAWRGVLNTKQLEYQATQIAHQAEQLAQTRRQNDAKDEENLAKLLMDGTKLLGEDRASHVLAGVAALQAVVASPKGAFASEAMDILVDLIEATYTDDGKSKIFDAAREAVNRGADAGRTSSRSLKLAYSIGKKTFSYAVKGVKKLQYKYAYLDYTEFPHVADLGQVTFEACLIEEGRVVGAHVRFKRCEFDGCQIKDVSLPFLANNTFTNCDFSGATFIFVRPLRKNAQTSLPNLDTLRDRGNWFAAGQPIVGTQDVQWEHFLDLRPDADVQEFK
ncbi:hypothetical protein E0H36_08480 [Rhizobium leguminosarum bv. viciae]|uniref:hypothetical protein n=1 Tax=Rhizobium leguminosarum TaxID=384 RepID=UPI00103F29B0|nr:hypothetical protein [Rhizobium leguminosarum]MBY5484416.1 hypothetical protein [Rhizobium leguminosarum]TBZ34475.1 hypothetical protein E0H36_08480 [Rhizobium leguminosarum bv. viciae]